MNTKKVTIRFIGESDAPSIQKYASDEKVARTCNIPQPYPANGGKEHVQRVLKRRQEGIAYAFSILVDGKFAGIVGINSVDREAGTAELDYWVAVPFWNNGVGTAAAAQAIRYAFENLNLKVLRSACFVRNPASGRVLEKNGFIEIGKITLGNEKFKGQPCRRFELLRSDWAGKNSRTRTTSFKTVCYAKTTPKASNS